MKLPPPPNPTNYSDVQLSGDDTFNARHAVWAYTTDQLRDYGIACARAALEAAAKECEITRTGYDGHGNTYPNCSIYYNAKMCAAAIRALEIET